MTGEDVWLHIIVMLIGLGAAYLPDDVLNALGAITVIVASGSLIYHWAF